MEPILQTHRLTLRQMEAADLDFVATMLADPDVMRFYPSPLSREESAEWIERQQRRYAEDGYGLWLALNRSSGVPVGQVGLVASEVDEIREPALTYLIHRPYWRRGFATEATLATRNYAFEELGLRRMITLIRPENVPSQGVARKIGMTPERETDFKGFKHIVFAVVAEGAEHAG